jgi:bifunctional non-homologous end joining protein LigD
MPANCSTGDRRYNKTKNLAQIEQRKARLARLLPKPLQGMALNECFPGDGAVIFAQACKLGCEGIVSKQLGSLYRSGRLKHWVKVKNPAAPAVRREAEEEWRR